MKHVLIRKRAFLFYVAREASEQCHRQIVPEITPPIQLSQLEDYLSEVNVVAYEEESKNGEHHAFIESI